MNIKKAIAAVVVGVTLTVGAPIANASTGGQYVANHLTQALSNRDQTLPVFLDQANRLDAVKWPGWARTRILFLSRTERHFVWAARAANVTAPSQRYWPAVADAAARFARAKQTVAGMVADYPAAHEAVEAL